MVLDVRRGKGSVPRNIPLSSVPLERLRVYYRWRKPKEWLFPSKQRHDQPLNNASLRNLCRKAGRRAGIQHVVYAKPPFGGPEQVLRYLARYTHRVAISNGRLLSLKDGRVRFRWRDSQDHNQIKEMSLDAVEFIRRLLLHILPGGFVKIRHFGFRSNRNRKAMVLLCRKLLPPLAVTPAMIERREPLCPVCKIGHLHVIEWQPALQSLSSTALHCQTPALDSS
jgi:hypothetical protein